MTSQQEEESSSSSIASEVLSACLGGAISASILYPLEVLKTKMQAAGSSSSSSGDGDEEEQDGKDPKKHPQQLSMLEFARQLYEKEGSAAVFWRGVETSAFQSALEKACYFFAYSCLKGSYVRITGNKQHNQISALPHLLLGCAAEWAHLPVTLPVDAWTTRIQTSTTTTAGDSTNNGGKTKGGGEGPLTILLHMLADENTRFYKGLSAYWLLCWKPALQYTVYEQVKSAYLLKLRKNKGKQNNNNQHQQQHQRTALSTPEAFLLGMVARTVATVLVFPFLRAKILLQTSQDDDHDDDDHDDEHNDDKVEEEIDGTMKPKRRQPPKQKRQQRQPKRITDLLLEVWRTEGLRGLYQGLGPELTRGVLSAALMLTIKERIASTVHRLLTARSRTAANNNKNNNTP